MSYGNCIDCGNVLTDAEMFTGTLCEFCERQRDDDEAEAIEREYEEAQDDIADSYGF